MILAAAVTLAGTFARAQEAPKAPAKPSGPFQICLYPNPCAPRRGTPTPPKDSAKPDAPKPIESVPGDPLSRAVLQGSITRGEDGIVSSIRLSAEHTGTDRDQIITRGTGLRDALAPLPSSASLPGSKVPANKNGAKNAAEDEWVTVESGSASAGQLNEMRDERKAMKAGGETSHSATGRMWKDKK